MDLEPEWGQLHPDIWQDMVRSSSLKTSAIGVAMSEEASDLSAQYASWSAKAEAVVLLKAGIPRCRWRGALAGAGAQLPAQVDGQERPQEPELSRLS